MLQSRYPQKQNNPQSGTDYNSVSNPFDTSYIKQTFWDKIANAFGARSSYDIAESERLQNQALWNTQMAETKREELYNSAAEVKAREEAAGLNPALSGQTIGGGSSDALQSAPMQAIKPQEQPALQAVEKLGSAATQAVQIGLSLATGIGQIKGINLSNDMQEFNILKSMFGLSSDYLEKFATTNKTDNLTSLEDGITQLQSSIVSASQDYVPKRYRTKFSSMVGTMLNSNYGKGLVSSIINKSTPEVVSASGNQKILSNFSLLNGNTALKPLDVFSKQITNAQIDLYREMYRDLPKLQYNSEKGQLEYNISAFDFEKKMKIMNEKTFSVMQNLVSKMEELTRTGNGFQKILSNSLLLGLSTVMMGLLPNVNVSSGSSWREGKLGGSQNHSFGITW